MALSASPGVIAPFPKHQFLDSNGDPYSGAKLFTYESGTTTKLATYSDADLTSANANPIVLDSAGRATIFLAGDRYTFVLAPSTDTDPPAAAIWTVDGVAASATFDTGVKIDGVAGETLVVSDIVYLSDGSGSLTVGRWYKVDADNAYSSSRAKAVGVCATAAAAAAATSVILMGRLTGGSGYSAGSVYYCSATAGALTSTRPQNARVVAVADTATSLVLTPPDKLSAIERYEDSPSMVAVGNVGAGEDTLHSHTLAAGLLPTNGDVVRASWYGNTTNNANAKTLRIRVIEGANNNLALAVSLTVNETGLWRAELLLQRATSTAGRYTTSATVGPANSAFTFSGGEGTNASVTVTWANAVEIRLTGEATADNDIRLLGGIITTILQ